MVTALTKNQLPNGGIRIAGPLLNHQVNEFCKLFSRCCHLGTKSRLVVSIHRPSGYGPDTLPLRQVAFNASYWDRTSDLTINSRAL